MLCRAFIQVSEDASTGVNQKGTDFWNRIQSSYSLFCKNRVFYVNNKRRQEEVRKASSLGRTVEADSVFIVPLHIPTRDDKNMQQRWSRTILPVVQKMTGIESTILYDEGGTSGTNGDETIQFQRLVTIYKQQNNNKDCSIFKSCWLYLRDKPKFIAYTENMSKKARKNSKKRGSEEVTMNSIDNSNNENSMDGEEIVIDHEVQEKRPAGRDSCKNKISKGDSLFKMMSALQEDKKSSEDFLSKHLDKIEKPMADIGNYVQLLAEEKRLDLEGKKLDLERKKLKLELLRSSSTNN